MPVADLVLSSFSHLDVVKFNGCLESSGFKISSLVDSDMPEESYGWNLKLSYLLIIDFFVDERISLTTK